jgi:type VI secretion system secreted protein VgrG
MANFDLYFPKEIVLEGSVFEDVAGDSGGATKYGLTLDDLQEFHLDENGDGIIDVNDIKLLTRTDAGRVLKKLYWDYYYTDTILNQSVGEYVADAGLNQGRVLMTKYIQTIIGVTVDGKFGPNTLKVLNNFNQQDFFNKFKSMRIQRYNNIVANRPSQNKFLKGWINRVNAIPFFNA